MTTEKFIYEVTTVTKFIQIYCTDKHKDEPKHKCCENLNYDTVPNVTKTEFELCHECEQMLRYAYARLQACPHIKKPRCHCCPHPCYELDMWKRMAKMMKYSGMKLGLNKIKRLFLRSSD
ncbi:nitrous oxide-stimulated promoter family protein [Campylobacter sp. faydin G-24]|uniref:Nitrous oxide-stimulated promoter family protein n=1 Tax=Campylobacter anatolicus TaxID=2829105 RepID=A0ABS5HHU5_9BACT|nr:nitrous oxide-stimulated promoter family protein [Campylobacter anatolicus]MBR8462029.1 nitrous oxide-stimulated promoter family protein [Campylobacter anatolicus]MBR8463853.1 nitrous oxide-stimulated promoter family protein [Campylobacter anatolicus]MBR8464884.1 nitrous oxide-stimulated promoter family protein [Campylobacter anatolicus]